MIPVQKKYNMTPVHARRGTTRERESLFHVLWYNSPPVLCMQGVYYNLYKRPLSMHAEEHNNNITDPVLATRSRASLGPGGLGRQEAIYHTGPSAFTPPPPPAGPLGAFRSYQGADSLSLVAWTSSPAGFDPIWPCITYLQPVSHH